MLLFIYLLYIITLLFLFIFCLFSTQNSVDLSPSSSIELSQKIDFLLIQKQIELQKIDALQDQVLILLNNCANKNSLEIIFDLLNQNSYYLVGTFFFLLTFFVIQYLSKSDLEVLITEVLKVQKIGHDGHIEITIDLLQKFSDLMLQNMPRITKIPNDSGDLYFDQSFDMILKNMSELDRINIISLLNKIQEIYLKVESIDNQILQVLEILTR